VDGFTTPYKTPSRVFRKFFCFHLISTQTCNYYLQTSHLAFVGLDFAWRCIVLRACLEIVAAGFQPAIEGGILSPGPRAKLQNRPGLLGVVSTATLFPPGWKPGSTSAKMADATFSDRLLRAQECIYISELTEFHPQLVVLTLG
jgi:hypothetical protein